MVQTLSRTCSLVGQCHDQYTTIVISVDFIMLLVYECIYCYAKLLTIAITMDLKVAERLECLPSFVIH